MLNYSDEVAATSDDRRSSTVQSRIANNAAALSDFTLPP